jgi:hypothetical protein
LKILITQHLRRVVLRTEVLLFTRTKASSMKQAHFSDMFKKASKNFCTSTVVVTPDPLSPTPSTSSTVETPKNTKEGPGHPEPADEGNIQMEYFSD